MASVPGAAGDVGATTFNWRDGRQVAVTERVGADHRSSLHAARLRLTDLPITFLSALYDDQHVSIQ